MSADALQDAHVALAAHEKMGDEERINHGCMLPLREPDVWSDYDPKTRTVKSTGKVKPDRCPIRNLEGAKMYLWALEAIPLFRSGQLPLDDLSVTAYLAIKNVEALLWQTKNQQSR